MGRILIIAVIAFFTLAASRAIYEQIVVAYRKRKQCENGGRPLK